MTLDLQLRTDGGTAVKIFSEVTKLIYLSIVSIQSLASSIDMIEVANIFQAKRFLKTYFYPFQK